MNLMEAVVSLGNDQQYLWAGVLQGHICCLLDTCLVSIPCLDQLLTYKRSGSIFVVWVEWCDSRWEQLMRIVMTKIGAILWKSAVWRSWTDYRR